MPTKGIVKLKKNKKGEDKSKQRSGKYAKNDATTLSTGSSYSAGKEARASQNAINRADAISNQRARLQSLKDNPPTKRSSKQQAKSQSKFFKGVNKNQSNATEVAFQRQNTNTRGVQASVIAVEKAISQGKSDKKIAKISSRYKKTAKMNVCEGGGKGRM